MCQCLSRTVLKISALPRISLTLREGSQAADVEQVFPRLNCRETGSQRRRERREEGSVQGGTPGGREEQRERERIGGKEKEPKRGKPPSPKTSII